MNQLPSGRNEWHRGTVDVRRPIGEHLAAGLAYRYDRCTVDDFALDPGTLALAVGGGLYLGYLHTPHAANTAWLRLSYLWQAR